MTVETCIENCTMMEYNLAGLLGGDKCHCENITCEYTFMDDKLCDRHCGVPCLGKFDTTCGGLMAIQFYQVFHWTKSTCNKQKDGYNPTTAAWMVPVLALLLIIIVFSIVSYKRRKTRREIVRSQSPPLPPNLPVNSTNRQTRENVYSMVGYDRLHRDGVLRMPENCVCGDEYDYAFDQTSARPKMESPGFKRRHSIPQLDILVGGTCTQYDRCPLNEHHQGESKCMPPDNDYAINQLESDLNGSQKRGNSTNGLEDKVEGGCVEASESERQRTIPNTSVEHWGSATSDDVPIDNFVLESAEGGPEGEPEKYTPCRSQGCSSYHAITEGALAQYCLLESEESGFDGEICEAREYDYAACPSQNFPKSNNKKVEQRRGNGIKGDGMEDLDNMVVNILYKPLD